jgi:hypothetical protein
MMLPPARESPDRSIRKDVILKGFDRRLKTANGSLSAVSGISQIELPVLMNERPFIEWIEGTREDNKFVIYNGFGLFQKLGAMFHCDNLSYVSGENKITFTTNTITTTTTDGFKRFQANDEVTITGCTVNPGNNKSAVVVEATDEVLTFEADTFTAGAETAAITFSAYSFRANSVACGPLADDEEKSIVELNNVICIFPDKCYFNITTSTYGVQIGELCPDIVFACTHKNRIFGVDQSLDCGVYASKLGDYSSWADFSGDNDDSYSTNIYEGGYFSGITEFQDKVILFKANMMFELTTGAYNTPSEFYIRKIANIGCVSHKSIVEIDGVLYFMGAEYIYAYTGGTPVPISRPLGNLKTLLSNGYDCYSGVAGTDGIRYFICFNGANEYSDSALYTYCPDNKQWSRTPITYRVNQFVYTDDSFYYQRLLGLTNTGIASADFNKVYVYSSDDSYTSDQGDTVAWSFSLRIEDEEYIGKKIMEEIEIRSYAKNTVTVTYTPDSGTAVSLGTYSTASSSVAKGEIKQFNVKAQRLSTYTLNFSGTGRFALYGVQRKIILGSAN